MAVLVIAGLGAACGSDSKTTAGTTAQAGPTTTSAGATPGAAAGAAASGTITIKDFKFAPREIQAKVGDTITVVNADDAEHSLTATDKSFDAGRFAHSTRTVQVKAAGRFEFQCEVHPFMDHGFIQVSA